MWEWHIANLGEKHVERRPIEPSAYQETTGLFEAAADASVLDGRAVAGMWVVDLDSVQEDVSCFMGARRLISTRGIMPIGRRPAPPIADASKEKPAEAGLRFQAGKLPGAKLVA